MATKIEKFDDRMVELISIVREFGSKNADRMHGIEKSLVGQAGELNTKLAEISGKLSTAAETSAGLRRDVDKLPTKYDVSVIMVFVIGGLAAVAGLLKTGWPLLSKLFAS